MQSEGGIRIPDDEYLLAVQGLCRHNGSLFVLDEVQTGMYRTGPFLAAHHYGLDPDIVVLAKALSGGLIPVSATLMSDDVYCSVYSSLKRAIVHASTFSENSLAMRAGLATLEVLEREQLGKRATNMGMELRNRLSNELSSFEMVKAVRGIGLLIGGLNSTRLLVSACEFLSKHFRRFIPPCSARSWSCGCFVTTASLPRFVETISWS